MYVARSFRFAFSSINDEILKAWHIRLGHLGWQNVIKLAKDMITDIDLIKPPFPSVYKLCSICNLQTKAYQNQIKPVLEPLDLVHSNVTSFFIE